ncbi:MAG: HD domain-containing phosphohydrolase [Gemmatimonadaceae bacterium]
MSRIRTSLLVAGGTLYFMMRRDRKRLERLAAASLETLLNAIDANDSQTGGHVRRVAQYSLILADACGVDGRGRAGVERVALFHDIGKIQEALFDITHDDESLSPEERRMIATHPARGAEVLAPLSFFYPDLGEGVIAHHERWDGSGYPRQLRGEEIPLAARIVAIADTFDAITHQRRYGIARSVDEAADVIRAERGKQFDPDILDIFLSPAVFDRVRRCYRSGAASHSRPRTPQRNTAGRKTGPSAGPSAPDIPFRWRSTPHDAAAPVQSS